MITLKIIIPINLQHDLSYVSSDIATRRDKFTCYIAFTTYLPRNLLSDAIFRNVRNGVKANMITSMYFCPWLGIRSPFILPDDSDLCLFFVCNLFINSAVPDGMTCLVGYKQLYRKKKIFFVCHGQWFFENVQIYICYSPSNIYKHGWNEL